MRMSLPLLILAAVNLPRTTAAVRITNPNASGSAVDLPPPPAAVPAAPPAAPGTAAPGTAAPAGAQHLFIPGMLGFSSFRGTVLVAAPAGSLFAFATGRHQGNSHSRGAAKLILAASAPGSSAAVRKIARRRQG